MLCYPGQPQIVFINCIAPFIHRNTAEYHEVYWIRIDDCTITKTWRCLFFFPMKAHSASFSMNWIHFTCLPAWACVYVHFWLRHTSPCWIKKEQVFWWVRFVHFLLPWLLEQLHLQLCFGHSRKKKIKKSSSQKSDFKFLLTYSQEESFNCACPPPHTHVHTHGPLIKARCVKQLKNWSN